MIPVVLPAVLLSFAMYLFIGFYYNKSVNKLGDIIPIIKGTIAKINNSTEFSASTVATTISLATVIVAFFELAPTLGFWLFWPAITTSLGLFLFSLIVKKIWFKMSEYTHRPSLHEFLGTEFNSKKVALIGAIFTSIGYLSMFAVELTVGSRFLAGMIGAPQWLTVIAITSVGFIYTSMGGFRTVVVTDRIQMLFVWLLLISLLGYYWWHIESIGSFSKSLNTIPYSIRDFHWDNSLIAFVFGIFFMNLFTYVSNMALWQRISGAQHPSTAIRGMWKSVFTSALSWGLFVVVAVGAFMVVEPKGHENLLITLLHSIISSRVGKLVIFCSTFGLFGAMLSTASTQLIAVSHTIYEDIIAPYRNINLSERLDSIKELGFSRIILIASAIGAVGLVELLQMGGFSVADLAFAIYGAALCLVPAILFALYLDREKLKKLSTLAYISIFLGFISGWGTAILGKTISNGNLVFWAPCVSIGVSSFILISGWLFIKFKSLLQVPRSI